MPGPASLYVHFPYCVRKCPYCDFYSCPVTEFNADEMFDVYLRHLSFYAEKTGRTSLQTLYFGGGTPSLMPLSFFERLIRLISDFFQISSDAEITLEANPKTSDFAKMQAFSALGVNRLSIGVQALDDPSLQHLGRIHTVKDALCLIEAAKNVFKTFSADFIYGRPDQTIDGLSRDLDRILTLDVPHLSFYQLTLHDGYRVSLPSEAAQVHMLYLVREKLSAAGYLPYEVSNFAKPGHFSRHNLAYWRYRPFIGIGPSAHSRLFLDGAWFAGEEDRLFPLSSSDVRLERLLMGLRLKEGLFLSDFPETVSSAGFKNLLDDGFLDQKDGRFFVTDKGLPVLDALVLKLA